MVFTSNYKPKYRKGVPKNYRHLWKYKGIWDEKKIGKKLWRIDFKATKGKKSRSMGQFKKGFKIHWRINADQYATKIGRGEYQTRMVGLKKLVSAGYKKRIKNKFKRIRRRRY